MKYFIIAGEPSGDLHGSNLIRGLVEEDPQARFNFWGGDKMLEAAGGEGLVKHYRETSFFGVVNVLKNLRTVLSQISLCKQQILQFSPDVIILIDYPSFNMKIAQWAHERGIRVYYYIAPKVWAWKEWRVKSIRKYVDRLYVIFPFEVEYFRSKGIEPVFRGNPLMDAILKRQPQLPSWEEFRLANSLDARPLVALVAGSRVAEVRDNLPQMVRIAEAMPEYQFVVTAVDWIDESIYRELTLDTPVKYLKGQTYETLNVAKAAIVTSGTATLETALLSTPQIVVFYIPRLYEFLRRFVLKIKWVSLVNINMQRETVKELIAHDVPAELAVDELKKILPGGSQRERVLEEYAQLRQMMGGEGSSARVARDIVQSLQKR